MAQVCRLCLQITEDVYYSIDENAAITSRNKIMILMPELELDVVIKPVLCKLCYGTINAAYEFKCACLMNEQRITEYLKNDKEPPINLCDLFEETNVKNTILRTLLSRNTELNLNMLDTLKEEEPDIVKIEKLDAVKEEEPNIVKEEPLKDFCAFETVYEDSFKEVLIVDAEKNKASKGNEDPLKGSFKCSNCSNEFTDLKEYEKHLVQCVYYEHVVCNQKSELLKNNSSDNTYVEEGTQKNYKTSTKQDNKFESGESKCFYSSTEFTDFKEHQKLHECDICYKKFMSKVTLLRHELSHKTSGKQGKSSNVQINCGTKCSNCNNKFLLRKDYMRHLRQCAPFKCKICCRKFISERRFLQHKLTHGTGEDSIKDEASKDINVKHVHEQEHKQKERRHQCEICGKKFLTLLILRRHILTHSQEKKFFCKICDKGFNMKMYLQMHVKRHIGKKPHACDTCSFRCYSKGNLLEHYRIHTGEKPYKCNLCEKSFTQSSTLKTHMQYLHSNEKPFICEVCGKRFRLKGDLQKHLIVHQEYTGYHGIHTEKRPYKCEMCEKSFAQSSTLKSHMQCIHSDEKPFSCAVCGKKFSLKGNLQKHLVLYKESTEHCRIPIGERPYKCKMCEKSFAQNSTLKTHMQCVHSTEKPFSCEVCGRRFSLKNSLRRHLVVHKKKH